MSSPRLAVGIGNTTVKLGVTSGCTSDGLPSWSQRLEVPTAEFQPASISRFLTAAPHCWLVASVHRPTEQRIRQWVMAARPADIYRLLTYRDLPIEVDVEEPHRLGLDRLAAAVGANRLRQPDRPAIVIDAGTALTVNLVSADGVFRGGVILPGFKLTTKALAEGTDLLPLITTDLTAEPPPVVGRSTEAAIRSGLFWGSVGAVRELVGRMAEELLQPPQVFVTGGDARRLAGYMAPDARFVLDLVLMGIASSSLAIHD